MASFARVCALLLFVTACGPRASQPATVAPEPTPPPVAVAPQPEPQPVEPEPEPEPAEPEPVEPEPAEPQGRVALTDAEVEILFGSAEDQAAEHRGGVTKAREDKHYLAGNERTLDVYYPHIKDVGGGYVGVGTDQAYLFMSWARPEIVWLVDYDAAVVEVHELYRLFFAACATADEFVALWDKPAKEQSLAIINEAHDPRRAKSLRRWYLGYRGWIHRRLRNVTRRMKATDTPSYLTDQEHYDFVRQMLEQRRVRSMVVDLHERKGLAGVAKASQALGVPIRLLYLSNAEEYWPRYPKQYRKSIAALPFAPDATLVRTLLIWNVNNDYRYNVQPVSNYLQWLERTYVNDVYDITHARPKAKAEGINFFETDADPEQSPSAKRYYKKHPPADAS